MLSPRVVITDDTTRPQITHSMKPSIAAFDFCPFTIITVFSDWMEISNILDAQTNKQTNMVGNDAINVLNTYSPFSSFVYISHHS